MATHALMALRFYVGPLCGRRDLRTARNDSQVCERTMCRALCVHRSSSFGWPIPAFALGLGALTMSCGGRTSVNLQATPIPDQTPLVEEAGNEGQTQNAKGPD